ncbi:MAG TPA: NERD domain-containing protein [Dehalococcoidales bacterium]|nr:NERD domain-containing protein [Dehalococcoidales bacterium]
MIPAIIPEDTRSQAEKKLFPVLKQSLNDSFTVFHSFNLFTTNLQNKFIEGEIDFLIFSAEHGLLVLEVKSGEIKFDGAQSVWFQNGLPLPKNPFEQASTAKHQLQAFLTRKLGYSPPVNFSHAVCFPDITENIRNLPSGADPAICLTAKDLAVIEKAIVKIMLSFQQRTPIVQDRLTIDRIHQTLVPFCEYTVKLHSNVQKDEQKILALTQNQCRMLDFIQNHKQVLIQGCAGSGKTLMAVKKARELASEGKKVLLLAFNQLLGEKLAASVKDQPGITASTYHDFCIQVLNSAGRLPENTGNQTYWERDIPEAFAEFIRQYPLKYGGIIVDEGQDFRTDYWVTIEELRQPDSYYYIFYDPDQNLFQTEMELPNRHNTFVLKDNCRNTGNIFHRVKTYTSREMRLLEGAPEGAQVYQYSGVTERQRRRYLRDILNELIENGGLQPEQIVILGGHSLAKTCLAQDNRLGNYTISDKPLKQPNVIYYHTYMKFKGCESDAVILLDVDNSDPRWCEQAMYTATSRAKHLLYIISK